MTGVGPVVVHLDPVALGQVRDRLNRVVADLAGLDELGRRPAADELGGHHVADAVTGFVDAWARERTHLAAHLGGCVRYLDQALALYAKNEDNLTRAVSGGVTSPDEVVP